MSFIIKHYYEVKEFEILIGKHTGFGFVPSHHPTVTISFFMIIQRPVFFFQWNAQISKFNKHIQRSDYPLRHYPKR